MFWLQVQHLACSKPASPSFTPYFLLMPTGLVVHDLILDKVEEFMR